MTRIRPLPFVFLLAFFAVAGSGAQARKTMAISPIAFPDGIDSIEPASRLFDSLIAAQVARVGFTVVSATATEAIWKRLVDSVDGYYSAMTGELDRVKYAAVVSGTLRELKDRFHADVWLQPWIEVVTVQFGCRSAVACPGARWDRVSEDMNGTGNGSVAALSLVVNAITTAGAQVYHGRAGIHVLRKGKNFQPVAHDELLMDFERNRLAIRLALDSLPYRVYR